MPSSGLKPSAAVLIATVRGIRAQSSNQERSPSRATLEGGLQNLAQHIQNLNKFRLPTVVAINRFPADSDEEINLIRSFCAELGVECSTAEVFDKGGAGGLELAAKVIEAAERAKLDSIKPLYPHSLGIREKIELIAREIYGAKSVYFESAARKKLEKFSALGFASLPVCMAKTQSSLSDTPKLLGAPKDWTLTVTDAPGQRRWLHRRCGRQHDAHARPVKDTPGRQDERGKRRQDYRLKLIVRDGLEPALR